MMLHTSFSSPARALLLALALPILGCPTKTAPKDNTDPEAPPDPEVAYQEGHTLLGGSKVDFERVLEKFGLSCQQGDDQQKPHVKACYNAGLAAMKLGKGEEAQRLYRRSLAADPGFKPAVQNLTVALIEGGHAADAVPIYEAYLAKSPDDAEMLNNHAAGLARAGRYDEAIVSIQKLLFKDPENTRAYKTLASVYFLQGNWLMSQLASGNALKYDAKDADIHNNIGLSFLKQGKESDAIVAFKEALKLDPENFEANMNLGLIAVKSADYALAAQCFQKILEKRPGVAEARVGMAVAFRGTAEIESALAEYEKILQNDKCNKLALYNKATVQFFFPKDGMNKKEAAEAAIRSFEAYAKCHGEDAVAERVTAAKTAIADFEDEERQRIELERQMKELEEKYKVAKVDLEKMSGRARLVWDKYKDKKYDPSWNMEFEAQFEYVQMAVESEDFYTVSEQMKYLDEYVQNFYKLALEMPVDEWVSGGPTPDAAPAPEGAAPAPQGTEGTSTPAPTEANSTPASTEATTATAPAAETTPAPAAEPAAAPAPAATPEAAPPAAGEQK